MVPPRTPAFRGRHMGPATAAGFRIRPPEKRQRSAELSATASAVATPFHVGVPNAHTPIALSSIVRIASIVTGSFRLSLSGAGREWGLKSNTHKRRRAPEKNPIHRSGA